MDRRVHMDEARASAVEVMRAILNDVRNIEKAVVIDDLFGRVRVVAWVDRTADQAALLQTLNRISH